MPAPNFRLLEDRCSRGCRLLKQGVGQVKTEGFRRAGYDSEENAGLQCKQLAAGRRIRGCAHTSTRRSSCRFASL